MAAENNACLESDSGELLQLSIFKKACQLIKTHEDKLRFNRKVLEELKQINKPLQVVGICGPYRSGKSYLANILSRDKQAFDVGHSTTAQTKGIWIKCTVNPYDPKHILIIMDSEGLGDADKHDVEHDRNLFVLTFLLSSVLVYNAFGVITSELFDKLETRFLATLADNIQVLEDSQKSASEQLFKFVAPKFILCLRDFYLHKEQDYLESLLTPKNTPSRGKSDKTRKCIKNFFPEIDCFALDRPADGKKLLELNTTPSKDLAEPFKKTVNELRLSVYDSKPKQLVEFLKCLPVNGTGFASLVETVVGFMQRGETINVEEAFITAAERHNTRVSEDVYDEFSRDMELLKLPVKMKTNLYAEYENMETKALNLYRKRSYPYQPDKFEEELLNRMEIILHQKFKTNREMLHDRCLEKIETMYQDMLKQNKGSYQGDEHLFQADLEKLKSEFRKKAKTIDSDEVNTVLKTFSDKVNKEWCRSRNRRSFAVNTEEESKLSPVPNFDPKLDTKKEKRKRKDYYRGQATEITRLIIQNINLQEEKIKLQQKIDSAWTCTLM